MIPFVCIFVFKCKIINNALIFGELSYIFITYSLCLFQLVLVFVKRQIFFWFLVCHHKKFGGCGLFVGTLLYLGVGYLIPCYLFYTLKMRYVFEHVCFSYPLYSLAFALIHLVNFRVNLVLI
jgi:hypothetical protein